MGHGLGHVLSKRNPKLIMLRISGYGQSGPLRDLPGFGVIAEAMGGFRYVTGMPGQPPVRPGISIGDSISALHGVIGVLLALYHRAQHGGPGQVIDVALYESVFNMMEGMVPEYDRYRLVREPAGSAIQGISPTNAYPCEDGRYVLIAGNGDSIFKRLMAAIGRPTSAKRRTWPTMPDAWRAWPSWTPPSRPGPRRAAWPRCWPSSAMRASGRQGLHRARHRRRPALPGARHDPDPADAGRR
jgi:crotonobetainyl-CoA:carnitine CoA-transferase CaiB-like acyl-CoA transferase